MRAVKVNAVLAVVMRNWSSSGSGEVSGALMYAWSSAAGASAPGVAGPGVTPRGQQLTHRNLSAASTRGVGSCSKEIYSR